MTRITMSWPIELQPGAAVKVDGSMAVVANVYDDGLTYNLVHYSWFTKIFWTLFGRRKCIRCGSTRR